MRQRYDIGKNPKEVKVHWSRCLQIGDVPGEARNFVVCRTDAWVRRTDVIKDVTCRHCLKKAGVLP